MRPILEYACPVWHAGLTKDQSNKLEGIQKRALRVILGDTLLPYQECLVLSGLTTLETRRHELLLGLGHGLLSQKHRDILPPNITQNKHDTRQHNKLLPNNPGSTQRYRKSFRKYFTTHFDLYFYILRLFFWYYVINYLSLLSSAWGVLLCDRRCLSHSLLWKVLFLTANMILSWETGTTKCCPEKLASQLESSVSYWLAPGFRKLLSKT